jgi:hypothetical protein
MSAPASIYHRGVLRVAGVVHVGPPAAQVGHYLRDAEAYARTAQSAVERHAREARIEVEQADECHRRSLVAATVQALRALGLGDEGGGQP